jgi:UMP-CMP kinase
MAMLARGRVCALTAVRVPGRRVSTLLRSASSARPAAQRRAGAAAFASAAATGAATWMTFAPATAQAWSEKESMASATAKPMVIFVLGGPGAGKGTMCAKLVEDYGFVHLSAGDLLRAERNSGSEQADLINNYIKEGQIVPNEITCSLIKAAMETSTCKKFLVDGYPRNADNREGWDAMVGDSVDMVGVLYFDCPEQTLIDRIEERGRLAGENARSDDNAEAMVKRLRVYKEETGPVIDFYDRLGKVIRVNTGAEREVVYEQVKRAVNPIVEKEALNANERLLTLIAAGDYEGYASLCDEDITCFDISETKGNLVEGLAFHK